MKRGIAFIVVILMLLSSVACTKEPASGPPIDISKQSEADSKGNVPTKGAKDLSELIPEGWHMLEKVHGEPIKTVGDLNKDGIDDAAIVIEEAQKSEETAPNRALLIAFGNKESTYALSIVAKDAILKADEGGVWGDPLEGISVDRGSLLISFYGGSNWRWYSKYRFRYQDNDWYLIGATFGSYFTGNATMETADEKDYNLLTGDFIIKKADENGKVQTSKGNRGKVELLRLSEFRANANNEELLADLDADKMNTAEKNYSTIGFELLREELSYVLNNSRTSEEIVKLIGEPEGKTDAVVWGADGLEHQQWLYNAKGLELDFVREDSGAQSVNSALISSPSKLKTSRAIGIGSTRAEAMEAYKEEISPEQNNTGTDFIVAGTEYGGLIFNLENDKVTSIFIGAGAE